MNPKERNDHGLIQDTILVPAIEHGYFITS
jgi:hypothetical protein